jgi:hypothetical protein
MTHPMTHPDAGTTRPLDLREHQIDLQQHEPPGDPVCSARRCRAHAVWALRWNNPRLHTPERRKTWLACDEHRAHLTEFLQLRGFLRDTVPLEELADPRGAVV